MVPKVVVDVAGQPVALLHYGQLGDARPVSLLVHGSGRHGDRQRHPEREHQQVAQLLGVTGQARRGQRRPGDREPDAAHADPHAHPAPKHEIGVEWDQHEQHPRQPRTVRQRDDDQQHRPGGKHHPGGKPVAPHLQHRERGEPAQEHRQIGVAQPGQLGIEPSDKDQAV